MKESPDWLMRREKPHITASLGRCGARYTAYWMYAEAHNDQATRHYEAYHAVLSHFGKRLLFFFSDFAE